MRIPFTLCLLTVAACGDSFKADGLDLPVDDLVASFVETGSVSFDSDDDGENDLTQRGVGVVLTDREDLCSSGAAIEDIDDIFAIQLIALDVNGPDPLRTNTSLFGAVLGPQDGDVFIGVRVIERVGGETVAQYTTRNLIDPEFIDNGEFWVSGRSVRDGTTTRLSGSFDAVLGADLSNPEAFDTDGSGDGENDYEAIDISVKGRVSGAQDCSTLNILP